MSPPWPGTLGHREVGEPLRDQPCGLPSCVLLRDPAQKARRRLPPHTCPEPGAHALHRSLQSPSPVLCHLKAAGDKLGVGPGQDR